MNPHVAYSEVTARLAVLPNIIRTRREDAIRIDRIGGLNGEFDARVMMAVANVKKAVAELEKALA